MHPAGLSFCNFTGFLPFFKVVSIDHHHLCLNDNQMQQGTTGLDHGTFLQKQWIYCCSAKKVCIKWKLIGLMKTPNWLHEQPLIVPKVTDWCAIISERIIVPYFLEDASESVITVTRETYREILREYLLPLLGELNMHNFYFQQDGATLHTVRETMAMLREVFPGLIYWSDDMAWLPQSPDSTSSDFFL